MLAGPGEEKAGAEKMVDSPSFCSSKRPLLPDCLRALKRFHQPLVIHNPAHQHDRLAAVAHRGQH
ncbi:hypothetical protein [Aromatoleum sp.]|uniref:hypothetical protein n=1 Tax=Aromatoleum sp. TaxID=2307007 RepID=UPI002FCB775F